MEVTAVVAHSGQVLRFNTGDYKTGDDFKAALSHDSSVPSHAIVALAKNGRAIRLQDVPMDDKIYVYDLRISQRTSSGRTFPNIELPFPRGYILTDTPNRINNAKSQESWQELFRARLEWIQRVVADCTDMSDTARARYNEVDAMMECIDTAITNLETVLDPVKRNYNELQVALGPAQKEYSMLVKRWESYLSLARSITVDAGVAESMTERSMSPKSRMGRAVTLEDLLDIEMVKRSSRQAPQALRQFNLRIAELEKLAARTLQSFDSTLTEFDELQQRSILSHQGESEQLLGDIMAVAETFEADYQAVMELSNTTKDLAQASKMAARHTERLLPNVARSAMDMDAMLQYATKERNAMAMESVDWLRNITDITTSATQLRSQVTAFRSEGGGPSLDYLRLIQQIPFFYAAFAVEAIRRRVWYDNFQDGLSGVAEDVTPFQNEEIERRKEWSATVGSLYNPQIQFTSDVTTVLETNMRGHEKQWNVVTKEDLTEFHEMLQRKGTEPQLIKRVGELIASIDKPTKLHSKRVKAFKNGSMHESALGRSGLITRDGNEALSRALEDENKRLRAELKSSEGRLKRLEFTLQTKSTSTMPSFQTFLQQLGQQNGTSNGSVAPGHKVPQDGQRSSANLPEHALQRLRQLEGELAAEKERAALVEQQFTEQTAALETAMGQLTEANSMKSELMNNMAALKREFLGERKALEDEIKQLKDELEEHEEKAYSADEAKQHMNATYDEKIQDLQAQIANFIKAQSDDALTLRKAEGQVEFLRKEDRLQRENIENLDGQLKAAHDENQAVLKRLNNISDTADAQTQALRNIHFQLASKEKCPEDTSDLIESVMNKCSSMLEKIHNIEGDMSVAKSELEEVQNLVKDLKAEKAQVEESLALEETTSRQLRESLADKTARVGALEGELNESRKQLFELRSKLSDGETGSESLRAKLEQEEKKVTAMAEKLASKQSQLGSLEEELRLFKDKLEALQKKLGTLNDRFDLRTEQTKDLTQKLYTQNDRLCRLLERMGFSITRKDGSMTIQRIPRAERSTSQGESTIDPGASIRRSGTLSKSPESSDLELLYWMNAESSVETEKYLAFMSELGAFDMDAFTETVYKRVKDIEHLARKLQRDARSYREKAHHYQRESHNKVTVKNFKENDLVMFLPTKNADTGAWAAFNIGHPHYFLREQKEHNLRSKDWLLARISRVQERVVDLSSNSQGPHTAEKGVAGGDNDNPYALSDGLRWYLIDANEDKPGAPSTPGLGKTTVAANNVDAVAEKSHARNTSGGKALGLVSRPTGIDGVSKTLSKSLESRRSSTSSRRALPFGIGNKGSALASEATSTPVAAADSPDNAAAESSNEAGQANGGAGEGSAGSSPEMDVQEEQTGSLAPEVRHQSDPLDKLLGP